MTLEGFIFSADARLRIAGGPTILVRRTAFSGGCRIMIVGMRLLDWGPDIFMRWRFRRRPTGTGLNGS